jgi:hypothetical protein
MRPRRAVSGGVAAATLAAIIMGAAGTGAAAPVRLQPPRPAAAAGAADVPGAAPAAQLTVATLTAATVHRAAVSCRAETCIGKTPAGQGCTADGDKVAGFPVTGSTVPDGVRKPDVDLWYSPACDAAWGHYYSTLVDELRQVNVQWLAPYGGLRGENDTVEIRTFVAGEFFTTMVPWKNSLRICAHPSGDTGTTCSGWR